LCLSQQDIDNLTFGLTISGVSSTARGSGRVAPKPSSPPKLKLFK
jgi:hypothetical protein